MKKLILFCLLALPYCAFPQLTKTAVKVESRAFEADEFIGFDKFGFGYSIKDNAFIKFKDNKTTEYKNVSGGKISHVDIENPLLIVLFYENFNTIVLLDNQLNEIRKINFVELNIPIVAHATGLASQNRLWIYDNLTQQIGLFDYLKNDYRSITTAFPKNLKYYQTDFNNFQWIDEDNNRYACDVFGKLFNYGKVADFDAVQILSDRSLLYSKNGKLHATQADKNGTEMILGVENSFKKFYYKDQILSIFTDLGITNYKIILP